MKRDRGVFVLPLPDAATPAVVRLRAAVALLGSLSDVDWDVVVMEDVQLDVDGLNAPANINLVMGAGSVIKSVDGRVISHTNATTITGLGFTAEVKYGDAVHSVARYDPVTSYNITSGNITSSNIKVYPHTSGL